MRWCAVLGLVLLLHGCAQKGGPGETCTKADDCERGLKCFMETCVDEDQAYLGELRARFDDLAVVAHNSRKHCSRMAEAVSDYIRMHHDSFSEASIEVISRKTMDEVTNDSLVQSMESMGGCPDAMRVLLTFIQAAAHEAGRDADLPPMPTHGRMPIPDSEFEMPDPPKPAEISASDSKKWTPPIDDSEFELPPTPTPTPLPKDTQKDSWVTGADDAAVAELKTTEWVRDVYVSPGFMNVGVFKDEKKWSSPMIGKFVCGVLKRHRSKLASVRFVDIEAIAFGGKNVRQAKIHVHNCQ